MRRMRIVEALSATEEQKEILIRGWVRTRRDAKDFSFLEINDGSCLANIQVIADAGMQDYEAVKEMHTGSAVEVRGALVSSPGKGQKWEVQSSWMRLLGEADPETYPLQKKRHSDEFLRSIAHLRSRTNKYGAMWRIRSEASYAIHSYFRENGFFYVHTPILTGSDCEGAGELFRVTTLPVIPEGLGKDPAELAAQDFFGQEAGLTVSGQLEAESLAQALGRVYTFGPTFRAENSNTARHAAEFWMIEPEMAFEDLNDNMELAEDFIKSVIRRVLDAAGPDIELFAKFVDKGLTDRLETILNQDFVGMPYSEAINILEKSGKKFDFPVKWGIDLQTEHERYLAEDYAKRPIVVFDYPASIKPFYMRLSDDGWTVAAMDVLVPGIGEIIGGSQREERMDVLERRMDAQSMRKEAYWWYLDLRRFGTVPHSGFGMGFERFLMLLTGVSNIRDVIPFPRTPKSLEF